MDPAVRLGREPVRDRQTQTVGRIDVSVGRVPVVQRLRAVPRWRARQLRVSRLRDRRHDGAPRGPATCPAGRYGKCYGQMVRVLDDVRGRADRRTAVRLAVARGAVLLCLKDHVLRVVLPADRRERRGLRVRRRHALVLPKITTARRINPKTPAVPGDPASLSFDFRLFSTIYFERFTLL